MYSKCLLKQTEWNYAYLCQLKPDATECHSEWNMLPVEGTTYFQMRGRFEASDCHPRVFGNPNLSFDRNGKIARNHL